MTRATPSEMLFSIADDLYDYGLRNGFALSGFAARISELAHDVELMEARGVTCQHCGSWHPSAVYVSPDECAYCR
jgi:hypothetical protein